MKAALLCVAAAAFTLYSATSGGHARFFVTPAGAALIEQGLASAAPSGPELAAFQTVPKPGVRFEPNAASATTAPWVDSNAWRYQRGLKKANYENLPAGSAPLAAAEAFTYGVEAILNPNPADLAELGKMLQFLKTVDQAPTPPLANLGVVDDGTPALGEVLNLLTRRNLLYRVVQAPDPKLDLNIRLGSHDFPKESATNPNEFAARVREKLGDDKRLVRLYGTSTAIAYLTGDAAHQRLFLLSYGRSRFAQTMRVRVLGNLNPQKFAGFGAKADQKLEDIEHVGGATEFSVPAFNLCAVIDLDRL